MGKHHSAYLYIISWHSTKKRTSGFPRFSHALIIWDHCLKVNGEMKTRDIYNDNDARRLDAMT